MNFAAMLAKAKPVEIPIRFVYTGVIHVYIYNINPQKRPEHYFTTLPDLDKFTESNIVDFIDNKIIKEVVKQSRCFSIIDLDFINNFKTKKHWNWFIYDTSFCSVKTKLKITVRIDLCKHPHPNETVELDRSTGNKHIFYSNYDEYTKELRRKYELKIESMWGHLL